MSSVPYIFASQPGPIPLSELDQNFANVKAFADSAGVVTASSQPAITSVGTLTSLVVSGNITGANLTTAGTISGQLSTPTQANITTVGTLNGLSVTGNTTVTGNVNSANLSATLISGYLTTAQQVNITQVGNLVSLIVDGNISGSNLTTSGSASISGSATVNGNISAGNVTVTNTLDASTVTVNGTVLDSNGNISTGNLSVTGSADINANLSVTGSAVISGNLTVQGTTTTVNSQTLNVADKNITVANNVSTSALIDGAGIDAGNPTVAYIRYTDASKGWVTGNNFSVGGNLAVTGTATITGTLTASTAANNVSSTQVATTAFVRNIIPTGIITMWYGSLAAVPDGWYLCDGTNGTPNLTDRFVLGAGNAYSVGSVGGNKDAIVVQHNHTATSSVTDPGHYHDFYTGYLTSITSYGGAGNFGGGTPDDGASIYHTSGNVTGITVSTSVANAGVSGTNANMPPYYVLAYIMKA